MGGPSGAGRIQVAFATPSSTLATSTPPNYVTPPAAQTGQLFQQIAAINNKYIAWGDRQISQAVPAIPASGPDAGTLTPAILNAPSTLAHWPGPKVPLSLSAAHVKLPPGTPANGSIVGLTPQAVATALKANQKFWPGLTAQRLTGALVTAAQFVMASVGNNPMSDVAYLDPYADHNGADQSFIQGFGGGSPAGYFTAPASQGGVVPLRQVDYVMWASYALNPTNYYSGGTKLGAPSAQAMGDGPAGHLVFANEVAIMGLNFHVVGSGLVNGKLTIGRYDASVGDVTLALIRDGRQERWYVTSMNNVTFGNTPSVVYWTAP